jgi:hypothetical protein
MRSLPNWIPKGTKIDTLYDDGHLPVAPEKKYGSSIGYHKAHNISIGLLVPQHLKHGVVLKEGCPQFCCGVLLFSVKKMTF